MNTTRHLSLVTARRRPMRRPMPGSFLGRPLDVYRERYRKRPGPDFPLAA